jgi:hypothetical protein
MGLEIAARLFDFDLDAANPTCDQVVNRSHDYSEDESHRAIKDRHEDAESEGHKSEEYWRRAGNMLGLLRVLSERGCDASEREEGEKD